MCSAETRSSSSTSTSPSRISFSFSFCHLVDQNAIPQHHLHQTASSSSDFEFGVIDCCRSSSFDSEFTSADQLFNNGTILPAEMMMTMRNHEETSCDDQDNHLQPLPFLSPLYSSPPVNKKKMTHKTAKQIIEESAAAAGDVHDIDEVQSSKSSSFWGFKRSSNTTSVNNSKSNLSFLFPIPVLPRSSSTTSSNKRWPHNIQQQQQQQSAADPKMVKSSSLSSAAPVRPQVLLRKSRSSGAGSYSVKVSPVLHFRAPNCICKATKTPSFLGCFFSTGGDSNGNKKKT